ncbi:hypothetical protein GCM10009120_44210 [Sphingobacterium siyangense subsp. cladoniae]|uniref:hypothetical protein n=1 Tax=Sphingobacterium siyangense TaxID=459529 RepID=UPI0031F7800B
MNTELLQQVIDQQADQIEFMSTIIFLNTIIAASALLGIIIIRLKRRTKINQIPANKRDIIVIIGPNSSGKTLLRKQISGNRPTMVIPSNELCYERRFVGLHEDFLTGFDIVIDATYKNEPALLVRHILMNHVTFHEYRESEPKSIPIKRVIVELSSDDFPMVKWIHDHQHMFANIYFTHCTQHNELAETTTIFFSTLDPTQSEYQALDTLIIKH